MKNYSISKEESERITILKFISIIFVVFIHAYSVTINLSGGAVNTNFPHWLLLIENGISQVVAKCGVPIFFILSSVLLFKSHRNYGDTLKKKGKSLLAPYLIWNTFWIVVFILLESLSITKPFFSDSGSLVLERDFFGWLKLYGLINQFPKDYPLWFMRDLMLLVLISPIIKKIVDKFPKTIFAISIIALIIPFDFMFKESLFWFLIGSCIVKMDLRMCQIDRFSMPVLFIIYVVSGLITLFVNIDILLSIFIFVSIVFYIRLSKIIYDCKLKRIFLSLAGHTFIIYVLHELTLTSMKKLLITLLPKTPVWLLIQYLFIPVFVITLCITFSILFKKLLPKLYSISTGER